jgi:hypothetical protein
MIEMSRAQVAASEPIASSTNTKEKGQGHALLPFGTINALPKPLDGAGLHCPDQGEAVPADPAA